MADYISRQKAIEAIIDLPNCPNGYSDTYDKDCIIGILAGISTFDVVKVVRCRECKHKAEGQGYCYKHGIWLHRMTFCSEGERRDDDRNG